MNALYNTMERFRPLILSILRIVVGLLFLEHGAFESVRLSCRPRPWPR